MTMRYYLAFDDTDNLDAPYGTGKLARWFESSLPRGCRLWAIVRQQLYVHEDVPYTSHNSGVCLVLEAAGEECRKPLLEAAVEHLKAHALNGSDPGLCLAAEREAGSKLLVDYGQQCTRRVVRRNEAHALAERAGVHLSAHGGTGDGVIGAMASVGLTAWGWAGRCIEFGSLRSLPCTIQVAELKECGMQVVSIDRDAVTPTGEDMIDTRGWCRPRLMGGWPVLLVKKAGEGLWQSLGGKRHKKHGSENGAAGAYQAMFGRCKQACHPGVETDSSGL